MQNWRLDTPAQTMIFTSRDGGLAEITYWSAPLNKNEDLGDLVACTAIAPTGGMLDTVAAVSICPEETAGFPGNPGMILTDHSGEHIRPGLLFDHQIETGDPNHLRLEFQDKTHDLTYILNAEADPKTDVIKLCGELQTDADINVHWLSAPVLPGPQLADEFITFTGRWCGEFTLNRINWAQGAHTTTAPGGRTSHERAPSLILPCRGTTETSGEAFGLHLGWSGGHKLIAEELPTGRRQIQLGATGTLSPEDAPFKTPTLFATRSGEGMNGVSQSFHAHVRNQMDYADPNRPRPVHYNCWEAVYFDHDPTDLMELATRAAELGAERFVLDDGWFGKRNDDTTSLGDWTVDTAKWPDGLQPFIDHVQAKGMSFGIWFEPEMINPESDLFKAHPGWILGEPDQPKGRNQLVLDISLPEVTEYLFKSISAILTEYPDIEYIKWDHNRVLPHASQPQTLALYKLLEGIRAKHPHVEIETCSSGGGRIDFGILERTQRFWTSDSNDAAERWKIQRGASYIFPPEITGSHIGPRICHTSGRQFPMPFRTAVAGSRAMGIEMDLRELTDHEAAQITQAIALFKERRALLHTGKLYRLDSADPEVIPEMHVAEDGKTFILYAAQMQPSRQQLARPLHLTGLDPKARYKITLDNAAEVVEVMNRGAKNPLIAGESITLSGTALMQNGLQLPNAFPDTIWTVLGERL